MTTTKPLKDKPFAPAPAPKLMPRPTAASAARAAMNATNRNNMNMPCALRMSPTKGPASPNLKRRNSICQRNLPDIKADQKVDAKSDAYIDTKLNTKTYIHETVTSNDTQIDIEKVDNKESFEDSAQEDEPPASLMMPEDIPEEAKQDTTPTPDIDEDLENENIEPTIESDAIQHEDKPELVETEKYSVTFDSTTVPNTPPASRPQSRAGSRPQTPKSPTRKAGGTRPSTPNSSLGPHRHPTPVSRPTTPQQHGRSPNPQHVPTTQAQPSSYTTSVYQSTVTDKSPLDHDSDIQLAYKAKQKQFQQMKKELDLKQQAFVETFENLRVLHERMTREGLSGGGEGPLHEVVVFNVSDWPAEEMAQLYRDAAAASNTDGAAELIESILVDEYTLNELEAKVVNIPDQFAELCLQAFSARQELIDWVKELLLCSNNSQETGEGETLQRIDNYNTQGLELCDALRDLKNRADSAVDTVSYVSKRVWRDQNALIDVGKSLVRDIARLKQDLATHAAIINEMRQNQAETENSVIESIRQELEEERATKYSLKDKLAQSENQLRQTRNRVAKMDRQLREAEASIATLTGTVKTLEDQSRQREAQVEARARKLRESLKTGEVASGHLAQQRDALQTEVTELKDRIEQLMAQHKTSIKDLKNQLKESKAALEEQIELNKKKEQELTIEKDAIISESKSTIEELKAKLQKLENKAAEQNDKKQSLPTAREMELLAELQATKVALRLVEDEVVVCKREKVRFLESLTKIADSDNKVGMQQKLAAELLSKEEIIGKMQVQMRELTKNDKLLEQKIAQYEQYVSDLQAHNSGLTNMEEGNETHYQELQKEILDLRMKLCESMHRNEELSETLAQKEQQLEQQDKTSRAQARVIKVREELINMLKNKETEQSRELSALQQDLEHRMKIVDEVNKQIAAKAVEIQELFATLESKQQQIHRLEKIVLALEEQQQRAQAQRTRHEEKIAALEHELAAGGYRRERKFLFF